MSVTMYEPVQARCHGIVCLLKPPCQAGQTETLPFPRKLPPSTNEVYEYEYSHICVDTGLRNKALNPSRYIIVIVIRIRYVLAISL